QREGLGPLLRGLLRLGEQDAREELERLRLLRRERHGRAELAHRFVVPGEIAERTAEVEMLFRGVREDLDGASIVRQCFLRTLERRQAGSDQRVEVLIVWRGEKGGLERGE